MEVGSGKGLFLQTAATQLPEHDFLGIEIGRKYARFTAARFVRHELSNAIILHGDGMKLFREILPDASLAAVHVYFPDPWWKKRHRKRRVLSASFLEDVARVLMAQGRFHFWTDVKDYFDSTLKLILEQDGLQGPFEVLEQSAAHNLDYRTHFERRTRLHGAPVYRSEFIKK